MAGSQVKPKWGKIIGVLADQLDLLAALNSKAASAHTHTLANLTQSGATNNQVPTWNGTAWVAADGVPGPQGDPGAPGAPGNDGADGIMSFPLKATITGHTDPPSYGFAGDDDTGMYSPGDGYIGFQANGQRRLEISQNMSEFFGNLNIVSGDLDVGGNISADNYPPTNTANRFAVFDNAGVLAVHPSFMLSGNGDNGIFKGIGITVDNDAQYRNFEDLSLTYNILQSSPADTRGGTGNYFNIDPDKDGFNFGTGGEALAAFSQTIHHHGTSNVGSLNFIKHSFEIGDGVDGFEVNGLAYMLGFGQIASGVNIKNQINGYGFQPQMQAGSLTSGSFGVNAFYDFSNYATTLNGNYSSFVSNPNIEAIANNYNYNGFTTNAVVEELQGNANFFCFSANPRIELAGDNGGLYGFQFNPQGGTFAGNAYGIWISMDNVTTYAGLPDQITIQDLHLLFNDPGQNNLNIEYVDDATAGSESAVIAGNLITVHIESGVSTALQIKAAMEANFSFAGAVTVTVTGVGSNPQTAFASTPITGGAWPGQKKAAYFDGDVEITGALSFQGNLQVAKIDAFSQLALSNNGGQPASGHSLITSWTCPDNSTIALADTLGVNTAALIQLGANSVITTGFLGVTALGLPAVAGLGANTTVDRIGGAAFALSLDAGAGAGSEIDIVALCRSIAIPNGITQVNRLYGYEFSLPFGDPGTLSWSFYSDVVTGNFYNAGAVKIGGSDLPSNASVALEIGNGDKAFLNARMNTTARDAMTAINGMQIYNTTTDKLQVYAAGAWVDLH